MLVTGGGLRQENSNKPGGGQAFTDNIPFIFMPLEEEFHPAGSLTH
jgi:hypothetical protein